MSSPSVRVSTAANIALVKYWGKSDQTSNQPATGSLSVGLEDLRTTTTITPLAESRDEISGDLDAAGEARARAYLDLVRQRFGFETCFAITTENNFPTGSGLASSASGFAALALGVNELMALGLNNRELSRLARRGSGSAARSIFGGYVEVVPDDDAYASQLAEAAAWPLDILVAVTSETSKSVSSTEAMLRTAETSPAYASWLATHAGDMAQARAAILEKDFQKLADVSEHSCLKMHAAIMTSRPPILYWLPATIAVMHEVQQCRQAGLPVFFSIDAGAQVKVICMPAVSAEISERLAAIAGVSRVIATRAGGEPAVSVQDA